MEKPFSQFWGHTLYEGTNFEEKILSDTSCGISLTKFSISSYHLAKSENYCQQSRAAPPTILRIMVVLLLKEDVR